MGANNKLVEGQNRSKILIAGQSARLRKRIGTRLRVERKQAGYNLSQLSKRLEASGYPISSPQLSRIENGDVAADTDLLIVLSNLFDIRLRELLDPPIEPFFIVRGKISRERLDEVYKGTRKLKRRGDSHNDLFEQSIYHYVPLEDSPDFVPNSGDRQGKMKPLMRKYFFQVGRASEEEMRNGLDSHPGEEIIYVINGELEFWYMQERRESNEDIKLEEEQQNNTDWPKRLTLLKGDTLQFSSQLPHGFRNIDKTKKYAEALFMYSDVELVRTRSLFTSEVSDLNDSPNNEEEVES